MGYTKDNARARLRLLEIDLEAERRGLATAAKVRDNAARMVADSLANIARVKRQMLEAERFIMGEEE